MNENVFVNYVEDLGIDLTEDKLLKLNKYYELLIEKNKVMNLTTITEKEDVYLKHFYDSLTLLLVCDLNKVNNLCDVGTGAGLPGLVLKIVFPHLKVVLVDSLEKRVKFLKEVVLELELDNVEIYHIRGEEFSRKNRNMFDIVVTRAVSQLSILNEICLPMVKLNGYYISMKGNALEELDNSKHSLNILNSDIEEIKEFNLPIEDSKRMLIKIKKAKEINPKYPREYKEIKKKPL